MNKALLDTDIDSVVLKVVSPAIICKVIYRFYCNWVFGPPVEGGMARPAVPPTLVEP